MDAVRRLAVMLLAVLALLVTACGSGGTAARPAATSTPLSAEMYAAAAKVAAHDALLQVSDLPAGWRIGPPDDNSGDTALHLAGDCAELDDLFKTAAPAHPGAVAEEKTQTFVSGQPADITEDVASDAGVYRSVDEARLTQTHLGDLITKCAGEISAALEVELKKIAGIHDVRVQITRRTGAPTVGDQSATFEMSLSATGNGGTVNVLSEIIEARRGRIVGDLSYNNSGAMTQAIADDLTAKFVSRLSAADHALPR